MASPEVQVATICSHARPLAESHQVLIPLAEHSRFLLLGESTHGTAEFYRHRADVTRELIRQGRLDAVAVEGDWPDAARVNRYVRGLSDDADPEAALAGFRRFPTWMWRNAPVLEFVAWLRGYNEEQPPERRVGFYGIDLYSLFGSIQAVLHYLSGVDPAAAARARARYACFDRFDGNTQDYGYKTGFGMERSCEDEVVRQLVELKRGAARYANGDPDAYFEAEQNARLVANAEEYYRTMFRRQVSSWNLRDRHMTETLIALDGHLSAWKGAPARIAVWAHNSHVGDATATGMGEEGEVNVGQLARQHYGREVALVGYSTWSGQVTAAPAWSRPAQRFRVPPALPSSHEALLHQTGLGDFVLPLRDHPALGAALREPRLQRAIGVVYRPATERSSHYQLSRLPVQFDALVHIDTTTAVEPLERHDPSLAGEAPETYPSGV